MPREAMRSVGLFDIRAHPGWGLLPLAALIWHGAYTIVKLNPEYLFFVCYAANFLLSVGILTRSGLLTGTGFCWVVGGFPLWLHYAIRTSDWEPSGLVFHTSGLLAGALSMRFHRYPRYAWVLALALGAFLQLLARLFTDPVLNVNAAFRVYEGWEALFSSIVIYRIVMATGFGAFFLVLTWLNRAFTSLRADSA